VLSPVRLILPSSRLSVRAQLIFQNLIVSLLPHRERYSQLHQPPTIQECKTSKQWFYPMEGGRKYWPVDLKPQPYQDAESVASLVACSKFETATLVTMMSLRLNRWSSPEAVLLLRQATNRAPGRFHKESRWLQQGGPLLYYGDRSRHLRRGREIGRPGESARKCRLPQCQGPPLPSSRVPKLSSLQPPCLSTPTRFYSALL
jgi:hypothetical protein